MGTVYRKPNWNFSSFTNHLSITIPLVKSLYSMLINYLLTVKKMTFYVSTCTNFCSRVSDIVSEEALANLMHDYALLIKV